MEYKVGVSKYNSRAGMHTIYHWFNLTTLGEQELGEQTMYFNHTYNRNTGRTSRSFKNVYESIIEHVHAAPKFMKSDSLPEMVKASELKGGEMVSIDLASVLVGKMKYYEVEMIQDKQGKSYASSDEVLSYAPAQMVAIKRETAQEPTEKTQPEASNEAPEAVETPEQDNAANQPAKSLKQINKAVQAIYPEVIVVKGHNYFYIASDNDQMSHFIAGLYSSSIDVYRISHLTLSQWVEHVKNLMESGDEPAPNLQQQATQVASEPMQSAKWSATAEEINAELKWSPETITAKVEELTAAMQEQDHFKASKIYFSNSIDSEARQERLLPVIMSFGYNADALLFSEHYVEPAGYDRDEDKYIYAMGYKLPKYLLFCNHRKEAKRLGLLVETPEQGGQHLGIVFYSDKVTFAAVYTRIKIGYKLAAVNF